jgi:hypothetical protein
MKRRCARVGRWLDDGMPPDGRGAAEAHASGCARCTAALAAALDVEVLLAREPAAAAEGFTAAVMRRVGPRHDPAAPPAIVVPPTVPWWTRAAAEPAAAVGLALAAWAFWELDRVEANGARLVAALLALQTRLPILAEPTVRLGLAWLAVPVWLLLGLVLYRGTQAWVRGGAGRSWN